MAGFNWGDYEEEKSDQVGMERKEDGGFDWNTAPPEEPEVDPSTSPVTAAMTGLIQGAVPFAAPLAGIGRAAMDTIVGNVGPLATGGKMEDIVEDYRRARDSFSGSAKKAAAANPGTAFTASLAGGLVNPLFKGADSGAKLVGAGAVQGLGASDADLTKGEVGETVSDAALGGLGGGLGYGAGKAVGKGFDLMKSGGKKMLTTLGPSMEAIEARFAGKAKNAKSYGELAEDMASTVQGLSKETGEKSAEAAALLSQEANIPKAQVLHTLEKAKEKAFGKLGGKQVGATDKATNAEINALMEDITSLPDNVSQADIKALVQKLDDNINWQDQSRDKLNNILKGIRNDLDSNILKFQNSGYKGAQREVARRAAVIDKIKRGFNLKNEPGSGLVPTDTTGSKIQTSLRGNKEVTGKNLNRLKEFTGKDYPALAEDYNLAQQFEKTGPNGSRRTVLGGAMGALFGHLIAPGVGTSAGSAGGAALGALADKYGGQAAAKIIDSMVKTGNTKAFQKFAPVIQKAAERGPEALAATGAILSQNPEFQDIMKQLGANFK